MFLNSLDLMLTPEKDFYSEIMSQELSQYVVFLNVISAFHLLVAIPLNAFTLWVIIRTKSLWTASNTILSINGFFMIIGSAVMLIARLSTFPLLLFDEQQRIIAYSVAWWAFTLTVRIGNNR